MKHCHFLVWRQMALEGWHVMGAAGGVHNLSAQLLLTSRTVRNGRNGLGGLWRAGLGHLRYQEQSTKEQSPTHPHINAGCRWAG